VGQLQRSGCALGAVPGAVKLVGVAIGIGDGDERMQRADGEAALLKWAERLRPEHPAGVEDGDQGPSRACQRLGHRVDLAVGNGDQYGFRRERFGQVGTVVDDVSDAEQGVARWSRRGAAVAQSGGPTRGEQLRTQGQPELAWSDDEDVSADRSFHRSVTLIAGWLRSRPSMAAGSRARTTTASFSSCRSSTSPSR